MKPGQYDKPSSFAEETDPYVELSTGERFYIDRPHFDIVAIAHALSMNCRFNGHVKKYLSVAEHCVMVSELMERETGGDPLEGLLHDGHEAFLTDVPTPIKVYLPDWVALDHRLEAELRKAFGLPDKKTLECNTADKLALFIEARHLLPSRAKHWVDPYGAKDRAKELDDSGLWYPRCWRPEQAKAEFLNRYRDLL